MKIIQDLETGQIQYKLDAGEEYDTEEHLRALAEFVSCRAVDTFRLTKSYRKLVHRLDELEAQINLVDNNEITLKISNKRAANRRVANTYKNYFKSLDDISLSGIVKKYLVDGKLSQETIVKFAEYNDTKTSLVAVAVFAHNQFFREVLTRFHTRIQIYLDS